MFIQKYKKIFIFYLIFVFFLNLIFNLFIHLKQSQTKLTIEFIPPNELNLSDHLIYENYITTRISRILELSTVKLDLPLLFNLHNRFIHMLDSKKDIFEILKSNSITHEKYIRFEKPKITFILNNNQNLNYEILENKLRNDIFSLLFGQLDREIQSIRDIINNSKFKKRYKFHYERLGELFKEMNDLKENQIASVFKSSIKIKFNHEENKIDNFKRLLFFLISLLIIFVLMITYHKYNLKS